MTAAVLNGYSEPGKFASAVLAVLVHLALFALLFFGVQWRSAEAPAVEVELWNSLPPMHPAPPPVVEPPVKPETVEEPPPPEPVKEQAVEEPKPVPKVEPKPVPKPDIALKQEKLKQEKLEKEHQEQLKAEKIKKEQAADRAQEKKDRAEQLRKEQQMIQAQREAAAEESRLDAQRATAQSRAIDEYVGRIKSKIRSNIVSPDSVLGNPEAVFEVVQLPSGDILSAKLLKSSGNPAWDAAVERGILKSSPLPKPPEPRLFSRNLRLSWKVKDDR